MKAKGTIIFYLLLIIVYLSQGFLYPAGSILSKSTVLIVIVIGLVFMLKVLWSKKENKFLYLLFFFNVLIILGYTFTGDWTNSLHFSQLKEILFFTLTVYPIYYWSKAGNLNYRVLNKFFITMIPIAIGVFFSNQTSLQIEQNRESVVNNSSYMFVALMPFLYLIRKGNTSIYILFLLLALIVLGNKRGALITAIVFTIIFIFYFFKNNILIAKRNILSNFIFFSLISFLGVFYLFKSFEKNSFLLERLERNESTRPENYAALWQNWYGSESFMHLFFGFGYYSTPEYTPEGVMAHNDWLEMLNDFGLLGLSSYLLLLFFFIQSIKNQTAKHLKFMQISIALNWICISIFSMWMNNYINILYAILIGYSLAKTSSEKEKIIL